MNKSHSFLKAKEASDTIKIKNQKTKIVHKKQINQFYFEKTLILNITDMRSRYICVENNYWQSLKELGEGAASVIGSIFDEDNDVQKDETVLGASMWIMSEILS